MNTIELTTDVLIVGAGPAGLTAAASLARHGAQPLVVERHAATSPFPKATGVSTRTMEILRTWGLEERVREGAISVRVGGVAAASLVAPPVERISFNYPDIETALRFSPTTPLACPQDHIEPILADHVRANGGTIRFGAELTDLAIDGDAITADLLDRATGAATRVRARYLIGADGPSSRVRSALGIGLEQLGVLGDYITVYFRADLSAVAPEPWTVYAIENEDGSSLLVPVTRDGRWVYAQECGDGRCEHTDEEWARRIRNATGVPDLDPDILAALPFTMAATVAERFRVGNAFLVGDAAHRMTPIGGIGMNTAMHAAHNLGWKLAWVLRGWAPESLLDSYEPERYPVGRRNALRSARPEEYEGFDGLQNEIGTTYESSIIGEGGGRRAPHVWVRPGVSTIDLFDGRLTLLTGRRGHGWQRAAARLAFRGLPIAAFAFGRDLADPDGTLGDTFDISDTGAVLVRPDGFVSWRAEAAAADPRAALNTAVAMTLGRAPAYAQAVAG